MKCDQNRRNDGGQNKNLEMKMLSTSYGDTYLRYKPLGNKLEEPKFNERWKRGREEEKE